MLLTFIPQSTLSCNTWLKNMPRGPGKFISFGTDSPNLASWFRSLKDIALFERGRQRAGYKTAYQIESRAAGVSGGNCPLGESEPRFNALDTEELFPECLRKPLIVALFTIRVFAYSST